MKKKVLSMVLILAICVSILPPIQVHAAGAENVNSYGSKTIYEPVTRLYTGFENPMAYENKQPVLEPFKLFDYNRTKWTEYTERKEDNKTNTSKAFEFLTNEGYLLNKFMRFNPTESTQNIYDSEFLKTGTIRSNNEFYELMFDGYGLSWNSLWTGEQNDIFYGQDAAFRNMNEAWTGNIGNMIAKNDIQLKYCHTIYTKEYTKGRIKVYTYRDRMETYIMNQKAVEDVGTKTHGHRASNTGFPDISNNSDWSNSNNLDYLRIIGMSGEQDGKNDANVSNSALVGRDVNGPKLKRVKITSDPDGKNPIYDCLNFEKIANQKNRSVYFQLEFDEPVQFQGLSRKQIDDINIKLVTSGPKSTGINASAAFLKFQPKKSDSTQIMTFEYRIIDPYNIPADIPENEAKIIKERGKNYTFKGIDINSSQNSVLWNHLVDIAGNHYGSVNGVNSGTSTPLTGNVSVNLNPFHIKEIRTYTDPEPEKGSGGFVYLGGALGVRLYFNETIDTNQLSSTRSGNLLTGDGCKFLPELTLNLLDENNNNIVLKPDRAGWPIYKKVKNPDTGLWEESYWSSQLVADWDKTSYDEPLYKCQTRVIIDDKNGKYGSNYAEYNMQLVPGYVHLPEGESNIKVIGIKPSESGNLKGVSGNYLMPYHIENGLLTPYETPFGLEIKDPKDKTKFFEEYRRSPDRQYVLDFEEPQVKVAIRPDVENKSVIEVEATVKDEHLGGTDASYHFNIDCHLSEPVQYQVATTKGYTANNWVSCENLYMNQDFSGPIDGATGKGFAYIKLPKKTDLTEVQVTVTAADEPGNQSSASAILKDGWEGIDTMEPSVNLQGKGETPLLLMADRSSNLKFKYAWTDSGSPAPSLEFYTDWLSYTGTKTEPMTVPIPDLPRAEQGNKIYYKTLYILAKDDKGNEISKPVTSDFSFDRSNSKMTLTLSEDKKTANLYIENVTHFWYIFMEKPANYVVPGEGKSYNDYGDLESYIYAKKDNYLGKPVIDESTGRTIYDQSLLEFCADQRPDMSNVPNIYSQGWRVFPRDTTPDTQNITTNSTQMSFNIADYGGCHIVQVPENDLDGGPVGDMRVLKWEDKNYSGDGSTFPYSYRKKLISESSRPVILMVVGIRDDFSSIVRSVEFEPQAAPTSDDVFGDLIPAMEIAQVRLSTNDSNGQRRDYIRTKNPAPVDRYDVQTNGLVNTTDVRFWSEGDNDATNFGEIHDFVETEFYVSGAQMMPFDKMDLSNCAIQLNKVLSRPKHDPESYEHIEKKITLLKEWPFSELKFYQISDGSYEDYINNVGVNAGRPFDEGYRTKPVYRTTVQFDPSIMSQGLVEEVETEPGVTHLYEVSYQFVLKTPYRYQSSPPEPGIEEDLTPFSVWIFDNRPPTGAPRFPGNKDLALPNVTAMFDSEGKDLIDNAPVYFVSDKESCIYMAMDCQVEKIEQQREDYETGEIITRVVDSISRYGIAWEVPNVGTKAAPLGFEAAARIGTDPKNMNVTGTFTNIIDHGMGGRMHLGFEMLKLDVSKLINDNKTTRLYYQFYDAVRGINTPIYVMDVRKDTTAPIIELTVSETEEQRSKITVKPEPIYDMHSETSNGLTSYITDTPAIEIKSSMKAMQWQDGKLVELKQDPATGNFEFTGNGYIELTAADNVGNETTEIIINGKKYKAPQGVEEEYGKPQGVRYYVLNIDREPPQFVKQPTWTENLETGSVEFTAKTDGTASRMLIRFDESYSNEVSGDNKYEFDTIAGVPGLWDYKFDPKTGDVSGTIFVKPGNSTLKSVVLILEDKVGNRFETPVHTFSGSGISGVKAKVINAKGEGKAFPTYDYGGTLNFNIPVLVNTYRTKTALNHANLPIYSDGPVEIGYTDIFGNNYSEMIYANIFGTAFAHRLKFITADGQYIQPDTPTNQNITVVVDVSTNENLSVIGQDTFEVTENGTIHYKLHNKELGTDLEINLPITNIDREKPNASVSVDFLSAKDPVTGEDKIYSATYTISGYTEDVELLPNELGAAPSSVTFDQKSKSKTYTFKYRDLAGNIGSTVVDASSIDFVKPEDSKIDSIRLVFTTSSGSILNANNPILVNEDISVMVEALNSKKQLIPFDMTVKSSIPTGVKTDTARKSILFTGESINDRKVEIELKDVFTGTSKTAVVSLKANSIDQTLPIGKARFETQQDNSVRIYLEPQCSDLAENGVSVSGQTVDGKPLVLEKTSSGEYYVNFEKNGNVHFIMEDKAGNIGTVAAAAIDIDKDAPALGKEAWQSKAYADTKEGIEALLKEPTNNSIFAFIAFNEQLSKADIKAFESNETESPKLLTPTEDYVQAVVSGNMLTLEFKKNCQAQVRVYDQRGNVTVLWRPENGPITVIDRDPPKCIDTKEQYLSDKNVYEIKYTFNEPVMLVKAPEKVEGQLSSIDSYQNIQTVELNENSQYILTYMDKAGNVLSLYPKVSEIDDAAPLLLAATKVTNGAGGYSKESVQVCIKAEDKTKNHISFTAAPWDRDGKESVSAHSLEIIEKNTTMTVKNPENSKSEQVTYTHQFSVNENGVYVITATDKWGHSTTMRLGVTGIDRTPPTLIMGSTKVAKVSRNVSEETLKAAVLQGVSAEDTQSGAGENGITLIADVTQVDRSTPGTYTTIITAKDALGNETSRSRDVVVMEGELRIFNITPPNESAPMQISSNEVITVKPGMVKVSVDKQSFKDEKVHLYWAKGYRTAAQMKYGNSLTEFVNVSDPGSYYTIMAQSAERGTYLVYIYVSK